MRLLIYYADLGILGIWWKHFCEDSKLNFSHVADG
jgi:hypothetical protein